MEAPIRVLMVTSEWPTPGRPRTTHFIKRQADFLRTAGVDVDVFHFRGAKQLGNYARAWFAVRQRLASGRYDLVHAQFGQSGLLALPRRVPLVVTFRGSDLHGLVGSHGRYTWKGRALQRASRYVARHADGVILVSQHMKRLIDPQIDAAIIPSGLDLALFRPIPRDEARRHLGWPLDTPMLLFAGNPAQARKRYALAREAVDLLAARSPELVVAWGITHTDLPYYMSACDALVFTSMQEGSPNVVKEALACDTPVVSVRVGDVPERIAGIEGCELCDDDQPSTIAAAIERVLQRGGRRVESRRTVENLDETLLTQRVIEIYRSVIAAAGSRRRLPARASFADTVSGLPVAP